MNHPPGAPEPQLGLRHERKSETSSNRSTVDSPFSNDSSLGYSYGPPLVRGDFQNLDGSNIYGDFQDYSFRNISSLNRAERRRLNPRQSLRKTRRSSSGRYNSNVIRLANNNLIDTSGLYQVKNIFY